jgi:hypothetical protein
MHRHTKYPSSLGAPAFLLLFGISALVSILLLTGCGGGLSGQATGEDAEDIEALKQEIFAISTGLAKLTSQIEQADEAIEVLDASATNLARSVEQVLAELPDQQPSRTDGPTQEKLNGLLGPVDTRTTPDQTATSPVLLDWHLERYGEKGDVSLSETGSTYAFYMNLWSQPESDVVLSIVSDDTSEVTVSPSTLTFTSSNWQVLQTVTLTGVDDDDIDGSQTTTVTVSGVGELWIPEGKTLQVVTADYDTPSDDTPSITAASVFTSEDWSSWANGTYTKCTGIPCGALDVATWNSEPIYVKPSGVSSDPNSDWYWAYVNKFRPSSYYSVWTLAYVAPRYDLSDPDCARDDGWCWNVHTYCWGCNEPWGEWGNVTVTANYN